MRAGVLISAISHVVLVLLALLGTPKLIDGTVPPIMVELVPPDEAPDPPKLEKEKKPAWDLPGEQSAPPPQPAPPAQKQAAAPTQSAPDNSRQALLKPQTTNPEGSAAAPAPPDSKPSIFDPAAIPLLLDLPNLQGRDFDAESTTIAKLSDDERATFRARLRRCWKLPGAASLNQGTRVVLRIYLRRNATLAGDPVLIEASASRDGPAVMQAAMRALKDCQPFAFLPADKYGEWKVLDLSFTPRDMAGG
jgi:hypothetical protein